LHRLPTLLCSGDYLDNVHFVVAYGASNCQTGTTTSSVSTFFMGSLRLLHSLVFAIDLRWRNYGSAVVNWVSGYSKTKVDGLFRDDRVLLHRPYVPCTVAPCAV
jgi:hypothetical protein